MVVDSYCGSVPHSLLRTSKFKKHGYVSFWYFFGVFTVICAEWMKKAGHDSHQKFVDGYCHIQNLTLSWLDLVCALQTCLISEELEE